MKVYWRVKKATFKKTGENMPMGRKYSIYLTMLLGLTISIMTLLTDLSITNDIDIYLLYLIPLLLVFRSYLSKRYIISVTLINTIFILVKFYIPPVEIPGASSFNRIFFLPIMWIISYIQIQRKEAYSEINIMAERFNRITGSNIVGILISDIDGYFIEANTYYLNVIGYTWDEIKDMRLRWQDITPEEYLVLDNKANEELEETGISSPYEKQYLTKTGERKWVLIANTTLPSSKKKRKKKESKLFLSFVLEITRRKQAEEALSFSEFVLSEAQRVAHIGSYTFRYESNISKWSDEMYRIFGKDKALWTPTMENVLECLHSETLASNLVFS